MTLNSNSYKLDSLIDQDESFAIFRLPEDTAPTFVMQKLGEPIQLFDIEEINIKHNNSIQDFENQLKAEEINKSKFNSYLKQIITTN